MIPLCEALFLSPDDPGFPHSLWRELSDADRSDWLRLRNRTADPVRTLPELRRLFLDHSGIPRWLYTRCREETGDAVEAISRAWPREGTGLYWRWAEWRSVPDTLSSSMDPDSTLLDWWDRAITPERLLLNRLLTGRMPPPMSAEWTDWLQDPSRNPKPEPPGPRTREPRDPDAPPLATCRAEFLYAVLTPEPSYTFGLRRDDETVPFARLTGPLPPDQEKALHAWMDAHTVEKKGPVRVVAPGLPVLLSYTSLRAAPRKRAGLEPVDPWIESVEPSGGLFPIDELPRL